MSMMSGALDGIRIIDCGVVQLGPTAGTLLGDLGADVIKVEPPITGEMGRGIEILANAASRIQTGGAHFESWNRNKRGMTVNLNLGEGREIFYQLIKTADVMLNNWRKGVAEKLGVDYEPNSPVTTLFEDGQGHIKPEIQNERVLSAIIEFKIPTKKVPDILRIIRDIEPKIDTVFSVGVVSRFMEDGRLPIVDTLSQNGFEVRPNAKVNLGLGRR